jgi:hypothetical protein
MYLLYLDESGSVTSRDEKYFVLAGIAVFERQAYWLQNSLERLASTLGHPTPETLEIHGSVIHSGRSWWRKIPRETRRAVIVDGLKSAQELAHYQWRLFGVVVDKNAVSPEDPVEYAFEQVSSRFDQFLRRLYLQGDPQRGLIVLDQSKSDQETRLQSLATGFRTLGNRWGTMNNLADVPFFVDSKATRGIQYADLVAYAISRKYERDDDEFFNVIANWFDSEGGVVHGLHHYRNRNDSCDCPACVSRHHNASQS